MALLHPSHEISILVLALMLACETRSQSMDDGESGCRATHWDIEGPFYKANAPLKVISAPSAPLLSICESDTDDRLILNGTIRLVRRRHPCGVPVRALLDIWQADAAGVYSDHRPRTPDYKCRTRVLINDGTFAFSTIYPGHYDDGGFRPSHVHFLITPLDNANRAIGRSLTTQLYFAHDQFLGPNDSCQNCGSGDSSLVVHLQRGPDSSTLLGTWDVLLPL